MLASCILIYFFSFFFFDFIFIPHKLWWFVSHWLSVLYLFICIIFLFLLLTFLLLLILFLSILFAGLSHVVTIWKFIAKDNKRYGKNFIYFFFFFSPQTKIRHRAIKISISKLDGRHRYRSQRNHQENLLMNITEKEWRKKLLKYFECPINRKFFISIEMTYITMRYSKLTRIIYILLIPKKIAAFLWDFFPISSSYDFYL